MKQKRPIVLLALTLGLLGTAVAAWSLPGIQACTGDDPTDSCWTVRGVAASVYVDPNVLTNAPCQTNAVQFVSSIYVAYDYTDAFPNNTDFIEFGWSVNKIWTCAISAKFLYVSKRINGVSYEIYHHDIGPTGWYRLLILQLSSSPGTFRFQWDAPGCGGGACRNTALDGSGNPVIWNPDPSDHSGLDWSSGAGLTSAEASADYLDALVFDYHDNVWIENNAYTWKPANTANSDELTISGDTASGYCGHILYGSGSSGDEFFVGFDGLSGCHAD